eukprot:8755121-Heterocapsa_arctica.AAC.1
MERVISGTITGGVNHCVLNMVAPTPEVASEVTAVPVRRRIMRGVLQKGLAEEGAQRVERAPDGRVERPAGTDVQTEAPAEAEALGMRELASSST